jgi:hypothetical protein
MTRYFAHVAFTTGFIEADTRELADDAVDKLLDQLGRVQTDLRWDDVSVDIRADLNDSNCPNHNGAYDCTPFCQVCEGNQTYNRKES